MKQNKFLTNKMFMLISLVIGSLVIGACSGTEKDDNIALLGLFLLSQQRSLPTCANTERGCRIFITEGEWNGNLEGIAGADAKCNADVRKPSDGLNFKALLVDGEARSIRIEDQSISPLVINLIDWPLKANQLYKNLDNSDFANTTASSIFFLNESGNKFSMRTRGVLQFFNDENFWTGLYYDSMEDRISPDDRFNCQKWTSDMNGFDGGVGGELSGGGTTFSFGFGDSCGSGSYPLICVEQ